MPGAHGLRICRTCHGPMRALVALRVVGVSASVQRGQGAVASKSSVISRVRPQNGQTCPSVSASNCDADDGGAADDGEPCAAAADMLESEARCMLLFRLPLARPRRAEARAARFAVPQDLGRGGSDKIATASGRARIAVAASDATLTREAAGPADITSARCGEVG